MVDDAPNAVVGAEAAIAAQIAAVAVTEAESIRVLTAQVAALTAQVAELLKENARLNELLGRNSRNSNKPPSSDAPGAAPNKPAKPSGKKRGGQPGHAGKRRELVDPTKVDEVVDLFPPECENCAASLQPLVDSKPERHQIVELPPIEAFITEFRRHSVRCPHCQHKTCAALDPAKIPASPFGPRLMSVIALLTGVYHLSRRQTMRVLRDILGIHVSLGAISAVESRVSAALDAPVAEAWEQVKDAPVKNADGTSWAQSGSMLALWTIATTMATVFKIVSSGSAEVLKPLFGALKGILISDRATALKFWAMDARQICWAHLLRKFVAFSERDGPGGAFGRDLLNYTGIMFEYWHAFRDGKLSRRELIAWMRPVREQVEALLGKAAKMGIDGVSGSCADILDHRAALWTFLDEKDVEPTNNHAEREIRAFVLWRKRSFGTQSERGNLFAERIMTVAHTARKQGEDVLEFLVGCCIARRDGTVAPSLFARASRSS